MMNCRQARSIFATSTIGVLVNVATRARAVARVAVRVVIVRGRRVVMRRIRSIVIVWIVVRIAAVAIRRSAWFVQRVRRWKRRVVY